MAVASCARSFGRQRRADVRRSVRHTAGLACHMTSAMSVCALRGTVDANATCRKLMSRPSGGYEGNPAFTAPLEARHHYAR